MALKSYRASFEFELDINNAAPNGAEPVVITLEQIEEDVLEFARDYLIPNATNAEVIELG